MTTTSDAAGSSTTTAAQLLPYVRELQETCMYLRKRCRALEDAQLVLKAEAEETRQHLSRLEEHFLKNQTELTYAQQQLEFVVISLERQHGIVADHTEQLRLFAGETTRHSTADQDGMQHSPLLLLANWLYIPLVQFAKGVYTLFSPVLLTAQSLSLLNAEVLQRFTDDKLRGAWRTGKNGSLLNLLQRGLFDPTAVSSGKVQKKEKVA